VWKKKNSQICTSRGKPPGMPSQCHFNQCRFLRRNKNMPHPCLEWTDDTGQTCRLDLVDKVFIGRGCRGIEKTKRILVKDPAVSRDHAIVSLDGSNLQITDLSKNGVWVNGVRVAPGSSQGLRDGDMITVGDTCIVVRYTGLTTFDDSMEGTHAGPIEMIVTSLVADVRGFTGISQREDSSQVYAFMKDLFETLTAVVHDFKGTVKDYVGDAVYAFWDHGLSANTEQAVLACRAALHQLEAVNRLESRNGFDSQMAGQGLIMGWGITTGKVTMAHYSSRVADLALVGDATNLAFRLSGMANKDLASPIVICSQTAQLVGQALSPVDLGLVPVRGRTGNEHVYGFGENN
jgi:class 3 adenylate cyclase